MNTPSSDGTPYDPEVADDIVDALYEALLARSPDLTGRLDKSSRLREGRATPSTLAREMVASEEFAERLASLTAMRANQGLVRFTNDVSQYGEVFLLIRMWVNGAARHGLVVDVGARGRDRSNSFDLMRHFGWRGLLIEANPALIRSIEDDFAGLDMTLVGCAISDFNGSASLSIGVNDDVSSLDASLAAGWGDVKGEVMVDVRRLADVLLEQAVPHDFDLLSLDIEGEDIKVLNDLIDSSPYRPASIIIEARLDDDVKSLQDLPFSNKIRQEYELVDTTKANLILGRKSSHSFEWRRICGHADLYFQSEQRKCPE